MLEVLSFTNSSLTGVMPKEFGNLHKLEAIDLAYNSLGGPIPEGFFNLSMMRWISLRENFLSGNLPSSMGYGLLNLEILDLATNYIGGVIPHSFSNSSKLTAIQLAENKFTGSILNSFGDLRFLKILNLYQNNFTSDSPTAELSFFTSLSKCKNLTALDVSYNPLNGMLPESIGNVSTLVKKLLASKCKIRGRIPDGIGNLSNLILLDLSGNELAGPIPTTIRGMKGLQMLSFARNGLSGVLSHSLCALQELSYLYFDHNQFSGPIPDCLGNTTLRYLYLSSNQLNSSLPINLWNLKNLLELKLFSNFLSGSLPLQIGNLKGATRMYLSNNYFEGDLPSTFGDLRNLIHLSLAQNKFQGSIPDTIGKMISLEVLDLSQNNLSGLIPKSLEGLRYLKYFNVSFNKLRGEIPWTGPFENFTSGSFSFNEQLCGAPRLKVPPCPTKLSHQLRLRQTLLLVVGITLVVGVIALGVICLKYRKKVKEVPSGADFSSAIAHERCAYSELVQATEGFDESNLLGKGSFGSVYRGTLSDGRTLAIKVFNLQPETTSGSFETECQVLCNLRHRNLLKVISSCSNLDFKALILEFMPNGSLEKWLYSHNHFLNIMQRLDIMIDVASALHYLHQGYSIPIVHCDLKPSNILLDQDMIAHVSDFGIAKLLGTNTMGTMGYIAPEYGLQGAVSTKCDVYSYGITLMEVFTRITPNDEIFEGNLSLRGWANNHFPDSLAQIIDGNLLMPSEEYFQEKLYCVECIMKVALNCSRESPRERSHMGDVLAPLKKIKHHLQKYNTP